MILKRIEIDDIKWNSRVAACETADVFFLLTWYLDAVCENWCGYVLDDYRVIFPITPMDNKRLSFLLQPFLTRQFPLFGFRNDEKTKLLDYLTETYTYVNLSFDLEIKESQKRVYQYIPISEDFKENYATNHKRQLSKFKQIEVEISDDFNSDQLIELFIKTKGHELKHLGKKEYHKLKLLLNNANEEQCLRQYSMYLNNELIGSAAYLIYKRRMLFLKGIVLPEYQKKGGMVFLHTLAIDRNQSEINTFDFGGSNDKGLGDFNRKFGAKDQEYLLLVNNRLIWPLKSWIRQKFG